MAEGVAICGEGEVSSECVWENGNSWGGGEGGGSGTGSASACFGSDGIKSGGECGVGGEVAEVCFGWIFGSLRQEVRWGDLAVSFGGGAGRIDWERECGAGSAVGRGGRN